MLYPVRATGVLRPSCVHVDDSPNDRDGADQHGEDDNNYAAGADSSDSVDHPGCAQPDGSSRNDPEDNLQGRLDRGDPAELELRDRIEGQVDANLRGERLTVTVRRRPPDPARAWRRRRNPKNPWPERRAQADKSDPLETKLKRQVRKGLMKLAKVRAAIRSFKFTSG